MADNPRTNYLDKGKFCIAVRLIQLYQNGKKAQGVDLSGDGEIRAPFFEGVSIPNVPPVQTPPVQSVQPVQTQPMVETSTAITPAHDAFYMSPSDQSRYETLFPTYEVKKDGYVYGAEAVSLFSRSGLSNEQLRDVWNLSDDPVDNRLSKIEFCIAMHLIVCVSRKNLVLPQTLPPSLVKVKNSTTQPVVSQPYVQPPSPSYIQSYAQPIPSPSYAQPSQPLPSPSYAQQQPSPVPTSYIQQQQYSAPPPIPAETQYSAPPTDAIPVPPSPTRSIDTRDTNTSYNIGKPPLAPATSIMSITDAFSNMPNEPHDGHSLSSVPPSPSRNTPNEEQPPTNTTSTAEPEQSNKTPPLPLPTPKTKNTENDELSNLQQILQQMRAENISLKAQLNTYTDDEKEVKDEINRTIEEISTLSKELNSIRTQVSQANVSLLEATNKLKLQQEKKS